MIIIQLKYKTSIQEVEKYTQVHREFLDYYYKQGLILASGPMKPRTGGIIIALNNDRALIESLMKKDPFYLAEIADYEFIEFTPVKYRDELKELIQDMEG